MIPINTSTLSSLCDRTFCPHLLTNHFISILNKPIHLTIIMNWTSVKSKQKIKVATKTLRVSLNSQRSSTSLSSSGTTSIVLHPVHKNTNQQPNQCTRYNQYYTNHFTNSLKGTWYSMKEASFNIRYSRTLYNVNKSNGTNNKQMRFNKNNIHTM